MPTLKQLSCQMEWTGTSTPISEHNTTYKDGYVETHIAVPMLPSPFCIRLKSNGFIAAGLAMFVYIDGVYQCNRNRSNLKTPEEASTSRQTEVEFCVRQKEERGVGGLFVGRQWKFEKVQIGPDAHVSSKSSASEHYGTIDVVVLRCHASKDSKSSAKSQMVSRKADSDSSREDLPKFIGSMLDGTSSPLRPNSPLAFGNANWTAPPKILQTQSSAKNGKKSVNFAAPSQADVPRQWNPLVDPASRDPWGRLPGEEEAKDSEGIPGWNPGGVSTNPTNNGKKGGNVTDAEPDGSFSQTQKPSTRNKPRFEKLLGSWSPPLMNGGARSGTRHSPKSADRRHRPYWGTWTSFDSSSTEASSDNSDDDFPLGGPRRHACYQEPKRTISPGVAQRQNLTHYVHTQPGTPYMHRLAKPKYMDTHENPYAVFVFHYRDEAALERLLGKQVPQEPAESERLRLLSLSKEEMVDSLLIATKERRASQSSPSANLGHGNDAGWPAEGQTSGGGDNQWPNAPSPDHVSDHGWETKVGDASNTNGNNGGGDSWPAGNTGAQNNGGDMGWGTEAQTNGWPDAQTTPAQNNAGSGDW